MRTATACLLALLGAMPGATLALGLGEIRVESVLNEALVARIDLVAANAEDLADLRVGLADTQAFERVGLERGYGLTQLRFEAIRTGEQNAYIKITTRKRIREPFLNFIVEVTWPKGRILREYTVLVRTP